MLKNYLLAIWRYLTRNSVFALINLLGLVVGTAAFLLIVQYSLHEFSYDQFWRAKENIYRLQLDRYDKGELATRWAAGSNGIGPDLKRNFPEVKAYVRMTKSNAMLSHGDTFFKEENVYYTSSGFFDVFGLKLIEGVDSTALIGPNKMILSRSMEKKYFGNEPALGKTMRNNGDTEYLITGVYEDLPAKTHMALDAMLSFATFANFQGVTEEEMNYWQWDGFLTYILLDEQTSPASLESKLPEFVIRQAGEELKQFNAGMVFHLQALTDIHLDSDFIMEFKPNGSRDTANFLLVVAFLIILIAWINYINLSTAKSIERAREVGVRKVMGSQRWHLVQQFLVESLLFNTVAVGLAVFVVVLLTPYFADLTGRPLGYELFTLKTFWIGSVVLIVVGAVFSGFYPALVLSSYKPVEVLKGRFKNTNQGVAFRKGMIVLQFVASIMLIVGTYTVYNQITYMRSQQLGVNIEQTLVIKSPNVIDSTYRATFQGFKNKLVQKAEVSYVTASSSVPGTSPDWNAGGVRRLSQGEDESNQYRVLLIDHDFIPSYGLEVVAGRGFSDEMNNEEKSLMLNESAVRMMGFENADQAINDYVVFWGDTFRIVGVLKNYRQESLKKDFDQLLFRYSKAPQGNYSVRFNTANVKTSIAQFEEAWKEFFPGNPFNYFFLDEHYEKQYKADQQFGSVFGMFSGLAIFIASLGLFGLSSLTALQRTKEIGVRKVLGASVAGILQLISKEYMLLLGVAIAMATPLSWWVMDHWLTGFANRIHLSWWIFAAPSLMVVLVAMLTVSFHTLKAARTNPATSLRTE
ncbi:MAG: ABC transporter permease [Cyclobacteriaceae bacterium]|nr:ABC transporter permease [Cyclobacteriaceae bacterium]